jgi:hypothetical protein
MSKAIGIGFSFTNTYLNASSSLMVNIDAD